MLLILTGTVLTQDFLLSNSKFGRLFPKRKKALKRIFFIMRDKQQIYFYGLTVIERERRLLMKLLTYVEK